MAIVTGVTTSEGFLNAINEKGASLTNNATPDSLRFAINATGGNVSFLSPNETVVDAVNNGVPPVSKVTLTIDCNNGYGAKMFTEYDIGDVVDLSYVDPYASSVTIPEGKAYAGLTTTVNDPSTIINTITMTEDTTIYMYWADAITVTIDYNGGENTETGDTDSVFVAPAGFTYNASTFDPANISLSSDFVYGGLTTVKDDASTLVTTMTINSDTTLYVYWVEEYINFTIDYNGGSSYTDGSTEYTESYTNPFPNNETYDITQFNSSEIAPPAGQYEYGGLTTVKDDENTLINDTIEFNTDTTIYILWRDLNA